MTDTITVLESPDQITVTEIVDGTIELIEGNEQIELIEVGIVGPAGAQGPQGPQGVIGPQGPAGGNAGVFTYVQSVPNAVWTIDHNLGFSPSVTVLDTLNRVIEGDINYQTSDQVVLTFTAAFAGTAYLS